MLELADVGRLLDPAPMPLEMGIERLHSGVLHVAARTDMHGCTGAMLDWWFGWFETSQHYAWWHPGDHVASDWENWAQGRYLGAVHLARERLGDEEVVTVRVQFRPPEEFFDRASLSAASDRGSVSAVICARCRVGPDDRRDAAGLVQGDRLFHVARDTPFGCVLRTHFFLGVDFPAGPDGRPGKVTDDVGLSLMKHAYSEFMFLARVLPALHTAENRGGLPLPLPW